MRRLADVLPEVAAGLGLGEELRMSRAMATWERLVAELLPGAGASRLLAVQPPALVVSASSPILAQELRLRSRELLHAFAATPAGLRLSELRVVIRPLDGPGSRSGDGRSPV
jgi:hypothetical protein